MSPASRHLFLAGLVLLAGCSTGGLADGRPGETPEPTAATDTGAPTPVRVEGTGLDDFEPAGTVTATVTRIVDGDTVEVRLADGGEETVRLVGVDTPEVRAENQPREYEGVPDSADGVSCLRRAGRAGTRYTAAQVDGAEVTLAFDPRTDRRGGYGRLLAYVYVDGRNLNHELVAAGHARVYETDFAFRGAFGESETAARSVARGLWECAADDR
jgi:micrococcal nuclease